MRLILSFNPNETHNKQTIDPHQIQSFIYSLLKETKYHELHDEKGFKFFNFSNIFPIGDYTPNSIKKLIISSPDPTLISTLYHTLKSTTFFKIGPCPMELLKVKPVKTIVTETMQTATPILISSEPCTTHLHCFKQGDSLTQFFDRLKENAINKYNAFTGEDFELTSDLFTGFQLDKEVATPVYLNQQKLPLIGSLWKNLSFNLTKENKKFYSFLIDTGLGEKNSMGFGFVNCIKE